MFRGERESAVDRSRAAGVQRILNPGIDLETSRNAIRLAERFQEVYAAVGVHPNDASSWTDDTFTELRELARHPKVVAIGEIGLDYYRDRTPRDLQRRAFSRQLELAAEVSLPVVIHSRNTSLSDRQATLDVLALLIEWQASLERTAPQLAQRPGVLHSFSDTEPAARRAIEYHFMIGITGPVTFKNATELQQLVVALPLEYLVTETDAPFLTPHPFRGQRNEPAYVRYVAAKIAELRDQPLQTIENITAANAERLFNWRVTS
jgi:TatD DNase family protein